MLSENGKNASEPRVTSVSWFNHARFSSLVKTAGFTLKRGLPYAFGQHIFVFITHVNIDGIVSVCASKAVYKLQSKHLGGTDAATSYPLSVLPVSCSGYGLLTCTNTDRLSAFT